MDSFEFNKVMGAVLGALMFAVGLSVLSGILFTPKKPVVTGYDLPVPVETAAAPGAPAAESKPLPVLLASADVARGQNAAKKCASCHTFEKGGANKVGPNLAGVVGRPMAAVAGFGYSGPLKERGGKGEPWSHEALYAFLENPRGYVPGTSMAFAGIRTGEERADIIAYLRSVTDNAPPLPQP